MTALSTRSARTIIASLATLALVAAGCAAEPTADDDTETHSSAPNSGESDDSPTEPISNASDGQTAITNAESLLGLAEPELSPDVRVGRRGEEWLILTEDYVLGRMTVELDINDMDEWIVTAVTVELPDGPQTITRDIA